MAGTVLLNVMMEFHGIWMAEQVENYHRLLQNQTEPAMQMFFRIAAYRFGLAIILMAMVHLLGNYYIFYPVLFLGGAAFGYTLAMLSYCFGWIGILCMMAYIFPHYLIYVPLVLGILRRMDGSMYRVLPWSFRRSGVIFAVLLLGSVVESRINPLFLKIFLKTFL